MGAYNSRRFSKEFSQRTEDNLKYIRKRLALGRCPKVFPTASC